MNISTNKYLFRTYKKYLGKRLYIVFFLTLVAAFLEGFGITLLLPLIEMADASEVSYDSPVSKAIHAVLTFFGMAGSIGATLVFIAIIFLFKGVFKFLEQSYRGFLSTQLMQELKEKVYDSYNSMDYQYFIKKNTGHFINILNVQIFNALTAFGSYIGFLTSTIMAISYLIIAFLITWNFALMAIGIGFVILILFKSLNVYVRKISRKTAREHTVLNKFLIQTLQSFKYIISTGQKNHFREGVIKSVDLLRGYMVRQKIAQAFTTSMQEPVSVIFMISIVAIQVLVFEAEVGPILVALVLFYRGLRAVINVQTQWQGVMNLMGSIELLEEDIKATKFNQEINSSIKIKDFSSDIRFENVTFSYDNKDGSVIKNLNLYVPAKKTVAFVGESGAGKTTIADMLSLLLMPQNGRIFIDGVDVANIDKNSWRKQIGYVSQETVVFDDTIANNICLWQGDFNKNEAVAMRIKESAQKAFANFFIDELPDGYNTIVGERGVRLSGGQRQRLFIARELFKSPSFLILDEATSALDSESERYIQEGIDLLKGEITVVIIAHRLSTIKNADIIYVLDRGKIVEQGTFEELNRNSDSKFSKMVAVQSVN